MSQVNHGIRCSIVALALLVASPARAFMHVVKAGETLAQIASRDYGDSRYESVLVGANALDSQGGSAIVPGMRIEVPAPSHHRVTAGETWQSLALAWWGGAGKRADMLASANGAMSWVPPAEGLEIEIPPVVAHIASPGDSSSTLAARYLGDVNKGWLLNFFNGREEARLKQGEIILVPLVGLGLTDAGKEEARASAESAAREGETGALDAQRRIEAELPQLAADVRSGRYVEAVARGNRLLVSGPVTHPQLAVIHRALLEAYVALDAPGLASGECSAWKSNEPHPRLEPRSVSPKIRAVCQAP